MDSPEGVEQQTKRARTASTERDVASSSSGSKKAATGRPTPRETDAAMAAILAMKAASIIKGTVAESKSIPLVAAAQAARRGEAFASESKCLASFGAGGSKPQQLRYWIEQLGQLAVHELVEEQGELVMQQPSA